MKTDFVALGAVSPRSLEDRLAPFRLSEKDSVLAERGFQLTIASCDFQRSDAVRKVLTTHRKVPGLYFWLLETGGVRYKIYLGHTTDLAYRLTNYISEFQPHAPNDFKLRIFHQFVAAACDEPHFEFYVKPMSDGFGGTAPTRGELHEAENAALAKWSPILLNAKASPSSEAKKELERAFSHYYSSGFESLLNA